MILDFCDDSNLDDSSKNIFKQIINKNGEIFSNFITESSQPYHKNLKWWVSLPASRNNFSSELYYNFCICEFIKYLIKENKKIDEIKIKSKALAKILKLYFRKKRLKVIISIHSNEKRYKLKKYHSYLSINFINIYLRFLFYQFLKLSYAKLTKIYINKKINLEKDLTLIDTYLLSEYIEKDRYYSGLLDKLDQQFLKKIYFVPTIVLNNSTDRKNLFKIFIKLRTAKKKYLIKEDYLSFYDIFITSLFFLNICFLKKIKFIYNEVDYYNLIKEDLLSVKGYGLSFEGLINYKFIRNLKRKNILIKNFIDWWENQSLDKGIHYALNKFYPKSNVSGYLGYVPRSLEINLLPTNKEIQSGIIPKKIGVIGKGFINLIKSYSNNIEVTDYPALRFNHLWNSENEKINDEDKKLILIALPILLKESIDILDLVMKSLENSNNSNFYFIVKNHPAIDQKIILNHFKTVWPDEFSFTNENTGTLLKKINFMISGISSICMECLALGKPLIIVEKDKCLKFNPIPKEVSANIRVETSNVKDLLFYIKKFSNLNDKEKKIIVDEGNNIKNKYFTKPSIKKINEMLNIL